MTVVDNLSRARLLKKDDRNARFNWSHLGTLPNVTLIEGDVRDFGTVLGAMVMSVVRNGLNLLNVNVYWHQVVIGTIILIAVGIDVLSQRQWRK